MKEENINQCKSTAYSVSSFTREELFSLIEIWDSEMNLLLKRARRKWQGKTALGLEQQALVFYRCATDLRKLVKEKEKPKGEK